MTFLLCPRWVPTGIHWAGYTSRDDLERAERYVSSAWGLAQGRTEGGDLRQVSEKRGGKDKAIEAYARGTDGYRPPDAETRQRLSTLVGGNDRAVLEATRHRDDLSALRTV